MLTLPYSAETVKIESAMGALQPYRLSTTAVEAVERHTAAISRLVRTHSQVLTNACEAAGMSATLAKLCGGLLASVIEDLIAISRLPRTDFERTKRKQRVLDAAEEPAVHALRLAMAASPTNGRAAAAHWDTICEGYEVGKLAWLLGMDTETSWGYGKRIRKRERDE